MLAEPRRPSFAQGFPREPGLDELVQAFERGDYARVRAGAPALASSPDASVRAAVQTLVERTRPDPLATVLFGITAALLVLVSAYWAVNGNAPASRAPTPPARSIPGSP